ncbi:MAG: PCRF domain-containing protein, partial [bacterium]|nr:PCRF domain-containing protein [bacterium]
MTNEAGERLRELESEMQKPDFWEDKEKAKSVLKEISALKEKQKARHKYDKGDAVLTLFAGAGGDDAEDWARILFEMYSKFAEKKGWGIKILHEHKAPASGGYKNITFEVLGKGAYGALKNESGVHRLVRISPFSSKKLRHTSFVMLEVVPVFVEEKEIEIPEKDLRMEYSRSSGPGGQNVNKRETAVRIVHLPTGIAVHVDSERSQLQNKERAMELLKARIYKKMIEKQKEKEESMKISKTASAEWGHQIRSYVFHPYKMVKDHRTGVETSDVESVLEGEIGEFI